MWEKQLFSIRSSEEFTALALKIFEFQFHSNPVYKEFCQMLNARPESVDELKEIPFLPVEIFKSRKVVCGEADPEIVFTSSGTTGSVPSKHHVLDLGVYEDSFFGGFKLAYGEPKNWAILALLPSYLEREGSSLVYMTDRLIQKSGHTLSGFFLDRTDELILTIQELERQGQKTLLLGVSYALLDLIERQSFQLKHTVVMETGGMKGRRKELIRGELHQLLKQGFGVKEIHSEYGMTELLSQAYSQGNGIFNGPPWLRVLTRDTEDPLHYVQGTTGGINVIDLANLYSCSFISTQDLGIAYADGSFEIMGRFDHSDIRGCNLMAL